MLHQRLWESNLDLARACLAHRFVRALGDGSLDPDLFRGYIAQDALFLRAFAKAYALALARSEDLETLTAFHGLIGGALEELKLHGSYAAEPGIELARVVPNAACRAYTDFLLRTAWHGPLPEIVAATTPCMRLYAWVGAELAGHCDDAHPYGRWIRTYGSAEFERLAGRMEALLDRVAADTREVRESYGYALRCELDFFDAAMEDAA